MLVSKDEQGTNRRRLPIAMAGVFVVGALFAGTACGDSGLTEAEPKAVGAGGHSETRSADDARDPSITNGTQQSAPESSRAGERDGARARKGPGGVDAAETSNVDDPARPMVVSVSDDAADREGDTPSYIEITGAELVSRDGHLTMTISTAATLPRRLAEDDELAIYAFDVEMSSGVWSVLGQLTRDGWSAELKNGEAVYDIKHSLTGRTIAFTFPWDRLGSGQPEFSWTAATSLLTIHGSTPTARGGDSAPAEPAAFPKPSSSDKSN